jgi:glucose-6-phosphate 1-dehydrogenase
VEAGVLVLFGATGDLSKKKLFPALYDLESLGQLNVPVVGVASSKWDDEQFRQHAESSIRNKKPDLDESVLKALLGKLHLVVGDYSNLDTFQRLADFLKDMKLPVFYLAIAPDNFAPIADGLSKVGLTKDARVVVEKPFGRDLQSAISLDAELKKILREDQIFRIDHYLGKESVEDLLVFRFSNVLFEPVWNRNYIKSIQITMAEDFGIEGRGKFYEDVGALRDVFQNHLLQVLTMLTMEPPVDASSEAMSNEKVKLLDSIRTISPENVVRGQYVGYLDEENVKEHSDTETFVAVKLFIDNWRWAGVPIYVRTGKNLPETVLEAVVEFNRPPRDIFGGIQPNLVRFRLGARDGVDISLQAKVPGAKLTTERVQLTVNFAQEFGDRQGPYERLLDASLKGDHFRFTRIDAVLQTWKLIDDLLKKPTKLHPYFEGTWGPDEAAELLPDGWTPVGQSVES